MRYYSITLTDPVSGRSIVQDGNQGFTTGTGPTFTSVVNGATDPGALNIDFDVPLSTFDVFQGGQRIKIWGVGLKMLGQASNLANLNFTMRAGMAPGLPLATPAQAGVLLQGTVFQAYGNWQGVNQTLDLIINPGIHSSIFNVGIPFFWRAGTPLYEAVQAAIGQALPGFKSEVFIDSRLLLANDENGWYQNFAQFAQYLKGITVQLGSQLYTDYPGVITAWNGDTINVFDGSGNGGPTIINKQIQFQDLIGQPTWIGPVEVNFKTMLRADLQIGNTITFPPGIVTPYALTAPAAAVPNAPARSSTIFKNTFLIKEMHHFGNFRDPDADAWATSFVGIPSPKPVGAPSL